MGREISNAQGLPVLTGIFLLSCIFLPCATVSFAQDVSQTLEQDATSCEGAAGAASVEACSRLLEAEIRASARRQAVLLTFRALARKTNGEIQAAAVDLTEAIGLDEGFASAYEARADLLRDNDQCDLAIPEYEKVIKLAPDRVPPHISRGLCLVDRNEVERALADFDQAIKLDADNAGGYAVLALSAKARLNIAKGDIAAAIADIDGAIKLDPKRVALYLDRGTVWAGKGDHDKALADYDQAIKLDAENAAGYAVAAWTMKARLHAGNGDHDAAIADYDQAIKLSPKALPLYIDRASIWNLKGDIDRALADFEQAIKVDPDSAFAYAARGDFYRNRSDFDRALADYDLAIEKQPKDMSAYGNRGLVRFYTGDFAKAVDDFKRVVDEQPNAYSMLFLYVSRARAGRRDATSELSKTIDKLKAGEWPFQIAELYLGRKSVQAAEAAAAKPAQKCEAQFYIGELHLSRGARPQATKALQTAVDTCPKEFVEYRGAVEELKRLKQ